jgi:Tol biopolymer transport system component
MMGQQQTVAGQKTVEKFGLRRAMLATLAAAVVAANSVALASPAQAQIQFDPNTALQGNIVFISDRSTGQGVDNPEGDYEIFTMTPDGKGLKQLTKNQAEEQEPTFSPDGKKIAYSVSDGSDIEVYVMNADGSGKKNLSNTSSGVGDGEPSFSPDGQKIAYRSTGVQSSNSDGDTDVYVMNAADGSGKQNLSNNSGPYDRMPDFSPNGQKIAYASWGVQSSNANGDDDVYVMSAADGSGKQNLTEMPNDQQIDDIVPNHSHSTSGTKIAYQSSGHWSLNSNTTYSGDAEVFVMNADGSGKQNLSNNVVPDDGDPSFSPYNGKIAYTSSGSQTSNPDGDLDSDIYVMDPNGSNKKNITQTFGVATPANDFDPDWWAPQLSTSPPNVGVQPKVSSKEEQTDKQQQEKEMKEATKPEDFSK